tara:strand:- start:3261 stop:3683 length:423 start_codon:yes stop_codon:yes gene_type:complete
MSQHKIGRAGEYLAAYHLSLYFDEIFESSPSARYDFLVIKDSEPYKVQVKTSESSFEHRNKDMVRWDIKKKVNKTKKMYSEDEVDLFAFVYLPLNSCEFVANRNITATWQKSLSYIEEINPVKSLEKSVVIINELKEQTF